MKQAPAGHLPEPSAWPATLAAGVTLVAAGIVTNWIVAAAGTILSVVAIVGWIRLLLSEREPDGGGE